MSSPEKRIGIKARHTSAIDVTVTPKRSKKYVEELKAFSFLASSVFSAGAKIEIATRK